MYTFLRFPGFRRKAVTLNYDDGTVFDEQLIAIMVKHGLKGTFNINSGLFGTGRRLPEEKVAELYEKNGMEVACHGVKHLKLNEFSTAVATGDVLNDRIALEKMTGHTVQGFAYANGGYDDNVVEILRLLGIKFARTTKTTEGFAIPTDWLRMVTTCYHKNPKFLEITDRFLEIEDQKRYLANPPLWLHVWGHSYEFNDDNNWDLIETFAEKVGHRPEIWYVTTGEMYDYVKAFEALEFSADGSFVHNPTRTDLYLCIKGTNVFVPAGETAKLE